MKTFNQGALTRLRTNRAVSVLVILILIGFVGAGLNTFIILRDAGYDQRYLELSGEMRLYAQQIANSSREAASGSATAFDELASASANFNAVRKQLSEGSRELPSPSGMLAEEISELNQLWARLDGSVQTIIGNRDRIVLLNMVADQLDQLLPSIQSGYGEVVDILLSNGGDADQVAVAQRQIWLAERIGRNIDRIIAGDAGAEQAAQQFKEDTSLFAGVQAAMLSGDSSLNVKRVNNARARALLSEMVASYATISESMEQVFAISPQLLRSAQAANAIVVDVPQITQISTQLSAAIAALEDKRPLSVLTALLFVGLIVISLGLLGWQSVQNAQQRLRETAETNERNQTAILRLLDELADLADGDLTTSATVTEDFTGAIADSINYTIDQLRVLVSQINDTAVSVSSAAQASQSTALNLAQASESQAQEIAGASAAITEMAVSIDKVSSNARDSAAVAQRSVAIANTGAEVVQNTIKGMDNIREQIQETSKRIKRLGESSQEIGDIVSLINDIADQTNILALNAAIQASMAGDAGRGFAVVADEVQRLAERSSGATKQIEALVKTIQSDTNEAVISMEQTTSEVVRGARLAQDAGAALTEIETVSQELAELIQNISSAAADQAESAGQISSTMKVIQEITSQTSAGSTETARSIGALAEMTNDLRSSVAGFTLPEQGS
ncbi:methyl-accepting chemotaxis protein [Spongiibacter taiwanensis]|uniref:methyl-accepting chemotaxis protein n=1 Tax=Spongiibacter taiwanensis TaxID=1748242 RepID=UPI002035CD99|nr:methyl-accepting chemotaxis protein [Spongiibacter taiwanensis]USA44788.1 methyl-accepting chemotaxis protein [Spongiibacter taiwanensis]